VFCRVPRATSRPLQVRLPLADLAAVVQQLCEQRIAFADLLTRYAVVTTGEDKATAAGASAGAGGPAGAGAAGPAPVVAAVTVEGLDRPCGRFSRPKVPIL
jgi:hypothetical protein